jgi:tetratricopeptide (TPR) repeat protein
MAAPSDIESPDPDQAADLVDFITMLRKLRMAAGNPSYRVLAKRTGELMLPPQTISHTTVTDVFQPRRRRLDTALLTAIVRALGQDPASVGRWRAAYIRVQNETKHSDSGQVVRHLPADLATFTGRVAEMKSVLAVADRLASGGAPTAVVITAFEGMAGVGKTRLAVHAAHEVVRTGRFEDVQLYVNLRGFDPDRPPADPAEVLDGFLRSLGVPGPLVPSGLEARAAMFRDRMYGRNAVLLLDNAADEEQVRELIPAAPTCLVLITSRHSLAGLDGAVVHRVGSFDTADGVNLLARIVGTDRVGAEPDVAAAIVEACSGLPLAIQIAGTRLRSRPAWTLGDLHQRLADEGRRLAELVKGGHAVAAAFAVSYGHLDGDARRVFRFLGLHPGPDIDVPAGAALIGLDDRHVERILEELVDAHLVQQHRNGRYNLHDLLRLFALERTREEDSEAVRSAATERLLAYYLGAAVNADRAISAGPPQRHIEARSVSGVAPKDFADRDSAMNWCSQERLNLLAVVGHAAATGHHDVAWQLPLAMAGYFWLSAHTDEWADALRVGLTAAIDAGDVVGQACLYSRLGIVSAEAGRTSAALEHLQQALALFQKVGDRADTASTLHNLATVHEIRGDVRSAIPCLEQALDAKKALGDRAACAVTLAGLGKAYLKLRDYETAVGYCSEAIAIYDEFGDEHRAAIASETIGQAYREQGQLAESEKYLREALGAAVRLGAKRTEAAALYNLGQLFAQRDDREASLEYLDRAHDLFAELGDALAADVDETRRRIRG